jgi:hypothetical protein
MLHRISISQQFADRVREADASVRAIGGSVSSIDALVAQTRLTIAESRRLLARIDRMLAAQAGRPADTGRSYPLFAALTPTRSNAMTRLPAE